MKKTIIWAVFLFFIFSWTVMYAENTYSNEKYKINLEYPGDWQLNESPTSGVLEIIAPENTVTINILVYSFPETVTANGLQIKRMTSFYDGWINLGERQGTEIEKLQANVDDKYIALYKKEFFGQSVSSKEVLIGEYYYIKDKSGYVFSIKTDLNLWGQVQGSVRKIIDSFWVGTGERETFVASSQNTDTWQMIGGNSLNYNSLQSNFSLVPNMNMVWEFRPEGAQEENYGSLVFTDSHIYFSVNNFIYSLFASTGQLNWHYKTGRNIKSNLLFYNDIFYFITEENRSWLYGLLAADGNILFKVPLESGHISAPIFRRNHIFLVDNTKIKAIESDSGQVSWEQELNLNYEFYPVANNDFLVVLSKDNVLFVLNIVDGSILWEKKIDQEVLYTPIIAHNKIFLSQQSSGRQMSTVQALELDTGNLVWQFEDVPLLFKFASQPAFAQDKLILFLKSQEGQPGSYVDEVIFALDSKTGAMVWSYQLSQELSSELIVPRVTDQAVTFYKICNLGYKILVNFVSLETATGTPSDAQVASIVSGDSLLAIDNYYLQKDKLILKLRDKRSQRIKFSAFQ
jgi:outer membrane protein assembly factor BamB